MTGPEAEALKRATEATRRMLRKPSREIQEMEDAEAQAEDTLRAQLLAQGIRE